MRRGEAVVGKRQSVADMHHQRLMARLHDLVRERELKSAAALGVDPRTPATRPTSRHPREPCLGRVSRP